MSNIETEIYEKIDLTIHTVLGPLDLQDMIEELECYYSGHITKLTLWDLARGDQHLWKRENLIALVDKMKERSHLRKGGRTAIVVNKNVDFGISRMLKTYAELENIAFEIKVFRDIEKAKQWLGVSQIPN